MLIVGGHLRTALTQPQRKMAVHRALLPCLQQQPLTPYAACLFALQNMQLNPSHYSFLRLLGPEVVSKGYTTAHCPLIYLAVACILEPQPAPAAATALPQYSESWKRC